MIWRAATAALLVLVALLAWPLVQRYREQPPPPPPVVRLPFAAPPGTELGAGDDALDAAISPAGDVIAFVATSDGRAQLWQRRVDGERAVPRWPAPRARAHPAWSRRRDARSLFVAGGPPQELTLAHRRGARSRGARREPRRRVARRRLAGVRAASGRHADAPARRQPRRRPRRCSPATRSTCGRRGAPGGFVYVADARRTAGGSCVCDRRRRHARSRRPPTATRWSPARSCCTSAAARCWPSASTPAAAR